MAGRRRDLARGGRRDGDGTTRRAGGAGDRGWSRFGRAIALALGHEGADVAVNYHAGAAAAAEMVEGLEKLGRRAGALPADVAREDGVRALVDGVLARFGRHDVLVDNAGVMPRGPLQDVPVADSAATEGAVESFTRALAHEVGGHGVTVNAIAPGGIETDLSRRVMVAEYRARRVQELPVRRPGGVGDVA